MTAPFSEQLQEYVRQAMAAEQAALEWDCWVALENTPADYHERLQIIDVFSLERHIPPAVACFTDEGWRRENLRRLIQDYEAEHGEITQEEIDALQQKWAADEPDLPQPDGPTMDLLVADPPGIGQILRNIFRRRR